MPSAKVAPEVGPDALEEISPHATPVKQAALEESAKSDAPRAKSPVASAALSVNTEQAEQWQRVRAQALQFLSDRKQKWEELTKLRRRRVKETIAYVIFTIFVTLVALSAKDVYTSNFLAKGMRDFWFYTEFPCENVSNWQKDFDDLVTVDDIWYFLQGVVPATMYSGSSVSETGCSCATSHPPGADAASLASTFPSLSVGSFPCPNSELGGAFGSTTYVQAYANASGLAAGALSDHCTKSCARFPCPCTDLHGVNATAVSQQTPANVGPILGNNILVSMVRIRQNLAQEFGPGEGKCTLPNLIENGISGVKCFFDYDRDTEVTDDFPFNWKENFVAKFGREPTDEEASWMKHSKSDYNAYASSIASTLFRTSGYYMYLDPNDKSKAVNSLHQAREIGWIDRRFSRVVIMEAIFYNPNVNQFVSMQAVMEMRAGAGIIPQTSVRVVNLYRFGRTISAAGIVVEFVLFGLVVGLICFEIYMARVTGLKEYMKDGYNVMAWFNLSIFIVVIVLEVDVVTWAARFLDKDNLTVNDQSEFFSLMFWSFQVNNWNAFNCLLTWMRMLKYADVVSIKTRVLSQTISKSSKDIGVFMMVFAIIYIGYAVAFMVAFGQVSFSFHTFPTAIFTLFQTVLGDFDFTELRQANKVLGPILFVTFILVVIFLLVNMFLAIIMKFYDELDSTMNDDPDELSSHMRNLFKKRARGFFQRLRKKEDENAQLSQAEMQAIYERDREALEAVGITNFQEMSDLADLDYDGQMTVDEIIAFAKVKQEEEQASDPDAEISYLVFKVIERFNSIQFEQEELKSIMAETLQDS